MATLKISDLSVGDWVRVEEECSTISSIYHNGAAYADEVALTRNGICAGVKLVSELHPIPITAEILEKNGFVKKNYDNGKMWDWWCDNVLVRKYADEDIYRFIVALNSKHYTTTMVVGKHTHQLQHALRLAGVDKEINL